ncbi:MAG: hypothetical protein KAS66_12740 [Candidatus Omnitrophica bacterium]|nr:hypothetical protein [Candidatus Omnitrophota bacterium]
MTPLDWQESVLSLVSLAREQLSLARLLRQKTQIIRDMKAAFGVRPTDPEMLPTLLNSAQEMRLKAQITLKKIEIENGKMVTQGVDPIRLTRFLDGRFYQTWSEYREIYKDDQHLRGI